MTTLGCVKYNLDIIITNDSYSVKIFGINLNFSIFSSIYIQKSIISSFLFILTEIIFPSEFFYDEEKKRRKI
jgi:hypothetical protein